MSNQAQAVAAPPEEVGRDYFEHPWRVVAVLGTFVLATIPLCLLPAMVPWGETFATGFWLVVGATHIFLPLSIYLRRDNLDYFRSTRRRRALFFVIPPILFVIPCVLEALYPYEGTFLFEQTRFVNPDALTPGAYPALFLVIWTIAIRALEFYHVNMQSFGMLELFKRRAGRFERWKRTGNRASFLLLGVLLLIGFLQGGRLDPSHPIAGVVLAVTAVLVAAMIAGFVSVWLREGRRARALVPLAYYSLQVASMSLAVWRFELYGAALAIHYVEYHIMMKARCFDAPLRGDSVPDRVMGWFKRHRVVFYALLLLLASYLVMLPGLLDRYEVAPTFSTRVMASLLNGIFVVHYFIEAFIWRFGNPYFRKQLAPLYFHDAARPAAAAA